MMIQIITIKQVMMGTKMASLTSATNKAAHFITAIPSCILEYMQIIRSAVAAAIAKIM
jgi:hypothetical protein